MTHPKEQQQQDVEAVTPKPSSSASDDYWAWTPSVEVEEAREVVSAFHIEEQLLRDAQRRSLKVETVTATTTCPEAENYWDESTENDTAESTSPVVQAQHETSYWKWTSDAKNIFDIDSIVDNLVAQSEHLKSKSSEKVVAPSSFAPANYWDEPTDDVIHATRTHANYWTWESDAKQELVEMILKQEQARFVTSGRHIETNLQRAASDAYWNESPCLVETASDQYWNWQSSPQQVACTGAGADNYWDW